MGTDNQFKPKGSEYGWGPLDRTIRRLLVMSDGNLAYIGFAMKSGKKSEYVRAYASVEIWNNEFYQRLKEMMDQLVTKHGMSGISKRIDLSHSITNMCISAYHRHKTNMPWFSYSRRVRAFSTLVFLDAIKSEYPDYLPYAKALLRQGGLLIADNALGAGTGGSTRPEGTNESRDAVDVFNRAVARDEGFEAFCVPIREGVVVARRV